jgi:hypothetical protein
LLLLFHDKTCLIINTNSCVLESCCVQMLMQLVQLLWLLLLLLLV